MVTLHNLEFNHPHHFHHYSKLFGLPCKNTVDGNEPSAFNADGGGRHCMCMGGRGVLLKSATD